MAELEIPNVNGATTLPSTTEGGAGATLDMPNGSTDGHGKGYDGLSSTDGHANGASKPITIAVVGAGQRGQVRQIKMLSATRNEADSQIYASYALEHPELAKVVAVAEPRPHRRKVLSARHK